MPFIVKRHDYPVPPLRALESAERAAEKRAANKAKQKTAKPPRAPSGGTKPRKSI